MKEVIPVYGYSLRKGRESDFIYKNLNDLDEAILYDMVREILIKNKNDIDNINELMDERKISMKEKIDILNEIYFPEFEIKTYFTEGIQIERLYKNNVISKYAVVQVDEILDDFLYSDRYDAINTIVHAGISLVGKKYIDRELELLSLYRDKDAESKTMLITELAKLNPKIDEFRIKTFSLKL